MNEKLLSIILPVYNAENDLEHCLNNIIHTTYENKELIIVDDGSTDKSPEIIDEYSRKYTFIKAIHKKNEGVQIASQVALKYVRGEYLAFIDADDGIDLNAYENSIAILESKLCDVVIFRYINEYGDIVPEINIEPVICKDFRGKDIIDHFQRNNDISFEGFLWNKIWRTSSIRSIRFQPDLFLCSDVVFVWQALKQLEYVCYIEPHYYHYKYSQSSITKSSDPYKFMAALKAWKYIVSETKNEKTISYEKALNSYVIWNVKTAEHLPVFSNNKSIIRAWQFTRNNIVQNKERIKNLPVYYRVLANTLIKTRLLFSFESYFINKLKKNYYKISRKETSYEKSSII